MKCEFCKQTMRFFVMDPGEDNYWQCMVLDCLVVNR